MKGVKFKDLPTETVRKIETILEDLKATERTIQYIIESIGEKERKIRVAEDLKVEVEEEKARLEEQKEKLNSLLNERV